MPRFRSFLWSWRFHLPPPRENANCTVNLFRERLLFPA
nr:MAG TPA: hypothetical protein [Caudoviricetes sp.]